MLSMVCSVVLALSQQLLDIPRVLFRSLYISVDRNKDMEFSKSRQSVMMLRSSDCVESAPRLL